MKRFMHGMVSVTVFVVLAASPASAAERMISGTAITKRVISRSISFPGDDPRHAIVQTVREDAITSSDPAWNEAEGLAYEQSDNASAGGSHRGYLVIRHKNGDESHLKYEGADKITGEGSAREVSIEGSIRIKGGTGKFKGVKGIGKYKGKATATGSVVNWEATLEESD
jgi:hypothetical protein